MSHYMKSTFEYTKLRKTFGRQALFQTVPAHLVDSIPEDKTLQKMYILRNPVHRETQAALPQSEHDCNTKQKKMVESTMNHIEGGWPREVPWESEELVQRHRRRVQHDDSYVQAIFKVAPAITHCLDQNNAIEMYESYFVNMPQQAPVEKHSIKTANVFRDRERRRVSSIIWTNEQNPKLVVSHYATQVDSGATDDEMFNYRTNNCFIWDIHRESSPLTVLQHTHACWRIGNSPTVPEIFVGGMENGVVNLFDIRQGSSAVLESSVYNSHTLPITGLLYIHSRTLTEFYTGSPDGFCLWWDTRKLSEPTERIPMSVRLAPKENPSLANAEGVSSIQFDRGMPTRFLVGTESGLVINGNRMGKSHNEILTNYWNAHTGPVRAVHRSPCTMRMFITCGDFTVRIWSEEVRTEPIIVALPYKHEVTDVAWAPQRFSSYMSVCTNGVFYYWDLLRKYKGPVVQLQVSKYPLSKLTPHNEGELIAVGDSNGSTFLLQLAENMAVSGGHDKVLMTQVYDRETKREHILDNRVKEIHLKKKAEEEAAACRAEEGEPEEINEEEIDKQTEENYFKIVNEQLEKLGLFPQ
ncbi:dynein intermediate chain 3, ciliary [Phthorimaea operculella]|nr:dynein intermediate chain 3, ciliary [Phthorimaea operculella]